MRIAIYSDNFYPELSGISDSVTLLGSSLATRGHSIMYIGPHYSAKDFWRVGLPAQELNQGSKVKIGRLPALALPGSPTGQSRLAIPTGYGLKLLNQFKPDVIHTHSPFGVGLEALLDAKLLALPLVGTNHTPPAEFVNYSPVRADWFKRGSGHYFSWYYNRCRFVSAPSQSLLAEMRQFGFKQPARVISNPLDLTRFFPVTSERNKKELKRRFGLSDYTILYTGRLAEEKHVDVIIKAVKLILPSRPGLMLAVTGRGKVEQFLHDLTRRLGLGKQVKFFGFVDQETFPLLYQASDLFAIMSTAESQCLSMMQAMSSGLPVIGARARALAEYINWGNGLLVEPGNEQELAKALIFLLSHSDVVAKLGRGGRQTVKICSPVVVAKAWEEIYYQAALKH